MDLSAALAEVAGGRADDPLRPVTFIAPSRLAALAMRRDLARMAPHAAVRFETLPRIAELAGAGELALAGRVPLPRPVADHAALMVAREAGGPFTRVADLPGFARVLRRHFQRLRAGGIRTGAETSLPDGGSASRELTQAYGRFRALTASFYDDEGLAEGAAEALGRGAAGVRDDLGDVYVVPGVLHTAGATALLRALAAAGGRVVSIEDNAPTVAPEFVLMPDPATEAEAVARRVISALEEGAKLHEVAVFHGAGDGYPAMLASAFKRAGLPSVRSPGRPVAESAAGRAVLALLGLPAAGYSRAAVMDFLRLAHVRSVLPAGDGDVRVRQVTWDRLSREAGVTRGSARWSEALTLAASDARARAGTPEAGARAALLEQDAAAADELRAVVERMAAGLGALREEQVAGRMVAQVRALIDDYVDPAADGLAEVSDVIDQLAGVSAIGGRFDLTALTAAIEGGLRSATVQEGRLGEGVLIAGYRAAAGLRYRHVIACGAYEGAFPPAPGVEAMVDEGWWAAIRGVAPYIEDADTRRARERQAALRCLAVATGRLTVTAPLAGPGGKGERYPASVVTEAASSLTGGVITPAAIRRGGATVVRARSPFAASLTGPVLDVGEYQLRDAVALRKAEAADLPAGHGLAPVIRVLRMRRAPYLSEWTGRVGPDVAPAGELQQFSPTAVETYAICGWRYFLRSVLGLRALDEPEERLTIEARTRGTLVHTVLQRFFTEQAVRGRPDGTEPWDDDDEWVALEILDEEAAREAARGQAGLPLFQAGELASLRADIRGFLAADSRYRAETGARPAAFEWTFNDVEVGGRRFRGSADRVNRALTGNRAWIIDYKTGAIWADKVQEDDPFAKGTRLQLGLYAAALAGGQDINVTGRYWFVTQRAGFGVIEYQHSPGNAARLDATVRAIDRGIRSGTFPAIPGDAAHPGGFENCRFCDFDRTCSRNRGPEAAMRATDAAVAPWAEVGRVALGESGD